MKHFEKIVLDNGLRVILIPQPDNVAATVLTLVEAGSKYETKDINGLSHFLEHMCFKGTTKRPKAIDIAGELDGLGAEYNAFTSQEWTGYYAKVQAKDTEKALDLISDLYVNPVFDSAEIEKEKGVIIEEINMYEDLPPRKIHDLFMDLVYGDQPAGWNIAGTKEVIRKLNREDFTKYRSEHYIASATVLVVAGAFPQEGFLEKIKEKFKGMPTGIKGKKLKTIEAQKEPQLLVFNKKSDQTHLVLGVRAFDVFDKRQYALEVLADILGGGMSSRLFQKVREELGAAYYVRAESDLYSDHGLLAMSAGVDHQKIEIVIEAMLGEARRLVNEPVSKQELERAKDHLSGKMLLGLETSDAMASFYGGQEVLQLPLRSPEEAVQKVREVTAEEIQTVAKEIFKNEKLNLAIIGPYENNEKFKSLLRI